MPYRTSRLGSRHRRRRRGKHGTKLKSRGSASAVSCNHARLHLSMV